MPSNYLINDPIEGTKDLDDVFITDAWLVDQFVGTYAFAWGYNQSFGAVGVDINVLVSRYSSPIQVGNKVDWAYIQAGAVNAAAIKTDGTLWTWGSNNNGSTIGYGVLGNGTTINYSSPVQVGALTNWKQVSMNKSLPGITLAVKTDGTLWGWGVSTDYGELGNGTVSSKYSSPVQIGALTNWKQVDTNNSTSAAIKRDGTLWTWGAGPHGELGRGVVTNLPLPVYTTPMQVGSLTNWKQVYIGGCVYAIKTDGTLWAWGRNYNGLLGINNPSDVSYSSPIQVGSLTNWKQVATGSVSSYGFTLAVKTDGTLWGWGRNDSGQLGLGNTVLYYSSPVQVGSLTNWKYVTCGRVSTTTGFTAAIKTDGTLWTWGSNSSGILGLGNTISYSSPVQVGSLTSWKTISATVNPGGFDPNVYGTLNNY